MSRVELPKSRLANFPFRLLPHFQPSAEELERTLSWEVQFQSGFTFPTIALAAEPTSELSKESLKIQSSKADPAGDYILVTSPDTVLHPSALFIIKKQLKKFPSDFVYWDESSFDENSLTLSSYCRKGRPSKLSFIGKNVIGTSAVVKTALWQEIAKTDQSIDENLWSISLVAQSPLHIPLSLSSTTSLIFENRESVKNIQSRISDQLKNLAPKVVKVEQHGVGLRSRIELSTIKDPIGIVIPFKNQSDITVTCLNALSKQEGASQFHVRLINNNSTAEEVQRIEPTLKSKNFSSSAIINDPGYFNFARLNNIGISELLKLGCSDIVLMNNDVELESPNFLLQAQAWSRFPGVGLVGGTLSYPSGSIQSAGVNFSQVRPANVSAENMYVDKFREVDGLCFAAVLIRGEVLRALDGLDEIECPNGYGDTLFCQKAREKGFLSLEVPWLRATHHESASRGVRPEELELLELVQNGLRISDLWSDLEAERQPMIIPLGPASSAFQAVVRQVSSNRRLLATAEAVCKPIVKIGKGLRKQLTISKSN